MVYEDTVKIMLNQGLIKKQKVDFFHIEALSVTFCRKPIGFEEFLIRMVVALVIIINRRPKGRPCEREN